MTDETNQAEDTEVATTELDMLKDRARLMGISFSNNIKLETLRERINDKLANDEQAEEVAEVVSAKRSLREELLESQMKLVRVRVANLDPKKKDLPGEVFTIANEYIGTVKKFVPYGEATDDGYHLPFCIYTDLESRRFQNIRIIRDRRTGSTRTETTWQKEFALELLPQLTKEELAALAQAQQAAGSIESSSQTEYMV